MANLKPGQKAKRSGQYRLVGSKKEVTMVKGRKLPPTHKRHRHYRLTDPTKH
ncbi:MAG: hypothetical protein HY092_03555 [Candidatus Kerfeldbacteria bacterium]|nr:hypothetical protein [Candidatus Kerfeldbacteria bacterium]